MIYSRPAAGTVQIGPGAEVLRSVNTAPSLKSPLTSVRCIYSVKRRLLAEAADLSCLLTWRVLEYKRTRFYAFDLVEPDCKGVAEIKSAGP